jgi:hypothetical protein
VAGDSRTDRQGEVMEAPCQTTVYNSVLWRNPGFFDGDGELLHGQLFDLVATFEGDPPAPVGWPKAEYCCIADVAMVDAYGANEFVSAADPAIPDVETFNEAQWTSPAEYDPATGRTTFTSADAQFPALTKRILVTFNAIQGPTRSIIVANTNETITVLGDLSDFDDAEAGFIIEDYEVPFGTTCYDTGEDNLLPEQHNRYDILFRDRIVGQKFEIDVGCYEQQVAY